MIPLLSKHVQVEVHRSAWVTTAYLQHHLLPWILLTEQKNPLFWLIIEVLFVTQTQDFSTWTHSLEPVVLQHFMLGKEAECSKSFWAEQHIHTRSLRALHNDVSGGPFRSGTLAERRSDETAVLRRCVYARSFSSVCVCLCICSSLASR